MEAKNVFDHLVFSEGGPAKTSLLEQEHFELVRIALGKGRKIPPHQGGHGVFFLVLQGRGIFTCGNKALELEPNQYLHIKADETRGIQALEDLVLFAVKD